MRKSFYDYCIENQRFDLLVQWNLSDNLPLTPKTVSYSCYEKVHWACEGGHEWIAKVSDRTIRQHGCPICLGKRIQSEANNLASLFPELAAQWDTEKNGNRSPEKISAFSHQKVWWKCPKCGNEWLAVVKSRSSQRMCGCPACSGKTVLKGYNDLASRYPLVAAQWHPTKNGDLSVQDVTVGTTRKVWWRCERGHEWEASVSSRTHGCGCPVCFHRKALAGINDLATQFPEVSQWWDPEKNGTLTPSEVLPQSNRKVWWKCERGHSYQATVARRTIGRQGCPYCANRKVLPGFNDLATTCPPVAAQWHPTLNESLTPEQVTGGSTKKVWWKCREGHVWKSVVYSRTGTQQCGCPVCAGKVRESKQLRYSEIAGTR